MPSTPNLSRVVAVLGAVAAGLLLSVPSASASDTFFLHNDSKVASLLGTSLWGKGNTLNAGCRTGPFPGPTETGFTFNPGDSGSVTLTQDPFSKCPDFVNPLIYNSIQSPYLTNGTWVWIANDPVIGDATLSCSVLDQSGSQFLQSNVDGLSCTISDADTGAAGSFGSSAAPLRGGAAVAYVQHFPGSEPGSSRLGQYKIILRDRKGRVHGREKATIVANDPQAVRVPVSRSLRRRVDEQGSVEVKAVLRRIDGKPGAGDRATLTVMPDHPGLPF